MRRQPSGSTFNPQLQRRLQEPDLSMAYRYSMRSVPTGTQFSYYFRQILLVTHFYS